MNRVQRLLRKTAIAIAVLLPVLGAITLTWYRRQYVHLPPAPRLDSALPSPNAYDTLRAARKREVIGLGTVTTSSRDEESQPLVARKKLLAANAHAIATIRKALTQEYVDPLRQTEHGIDTSAMAEYRELARMLAFASRTCTAMGNHPEAMRCALDAVEMGVAIPRGGISYASLVGIACEKIGAWPAWELIDSMDVPTARDAARRLEAIEKRRWPLAETLERESHYCHYITYRFFARGPVQAWRDSEQWLGPGAFTDPLTGEDRELEPSEKALRLWTQAKILYYGPRTTWENSDRWMNGLIQLANQPWNPAQTLPPPPADPLSQMVVPLVDFGVFKDVHARADLALLTAYCALHAYRKETGTYPTSLEALTEAGYLDALPVDAFSATRASLRYRRESSDRMVLYSVGPDGKDDGGRAIEMRDASGKPRRGFVDRDKPGDFVARVNTW